MSYGISTAAQYAVRTLVHLARQPTSEATPVREIAEIEGIPPHFLAKLVGKLARGKLVDAFKGPGGGIRLARPPHKIRLSQVIEVIDGPDFLSGCVLGSPECNDEQNCPMHENWKEVKLRLKNEFDRISLAQLAASGRTQD
jgi:Rrf2 family protein